jgi:hypothetical protein
VGIYATFSKINEVRLPDGRGQWTELRETPGLVESRRVYCTAWEVRERADCFCCSCGDDDFGQDADCRNHGWDGRRPCGVHGLPGDLDHEDCMPISTQAENARQGISVPPGGPETV